MNVAFGNYNALIYFNFPFGSIKTHSGELIKFPDSLIVAFIFNFRASVIKISTCVSSLAGPKTDTFFIKYSPLRIVNFSFDKN